MAATPHVLLIPFPAQGHLNPFMQLAKHLSSFGVLSTLVTTEYYVSRILQSLPHHHYPFAQVRLVGVPDGLAPDADRDAVPIDAAVRQSLEGVVLELLEKLALDEQLPPVSCIIGDFFLPWTWSVAHKVNISEVVFWSQSSSTFAVYANLEQMMSASYDPFDANVRSFSPKKPTDPRVTCIPGLSPIHPADLPFELSLGEVGIRWLHELLTARLIHLHEAAAVLGNSFQELEPKVCEALEQKFFAVGPLISSLLLKEENGQDLITSGLSLWKEEDCSQWLDMQPPSSVVYISFGSITKFSSAQLKELALGIAASKQRFLWVIRNDSIIDTSGDVREALPKGFLDQTKDRGKIINWAPQALVLSHGAVGGFFSHCGWNSLLESFCAGVPILGWPHIMDQLTNCWLISNEWKVGLELKRDEQNQADRYEVESAVKLLIEGPRAEGMRARVAQLKDAGRRAVSTREGSSCKNLRVFVESYIKGGSNPQPACRRSEGSTNSIP